MSPRAARRAARLEFGDVDSVTEQVRDVRRGVWIERTARDIRYAWRLLTRAPRFRTSVAVLTLALGMGGTTAIFTLMDSVVLRPLPVSDPARLYRIGDGTTPSPRAATAAGACSRSPCTSD